MGNCTNNLRHKSNNKNIYQNEPADTGHYSNRVLPTLDISVLLANVKLINAPKKSFMIRFMLGSQEEIILPEKQPDEMNVIKWEVSEKIELKLTEYELRKTFLRAHLLHEGNLISSLKINMYQACVGPYRFDFEFPNQKGHEKCRICFNLKISQLIKVNIETENLEVFGLSDEIGDEYAFSIKTIFGEDFIASDLSSIRIVDSKHSKEKPQAHWSSSRDEKMPKICTNELYHNVCAGTLKYSIWQYGVENPSDKELVGESFISFIRILTNSSTHIKSEGIEIEKRSMDLVEKLLSNGKEVGQIKIKLIIELEKHIKQMTFCVATEMGILKTNPVYSVNSHNLIKSQNEYIQQLQTINEALISEEEELEKKKEYMSHDSRLNIKNNLEKISQYLEKLLEILEKSEGQTMNMFTYSNFDELQNAQHIFLEIGLKLLNYLNNESEKIELLKCKILSVIIFRGELSLVHIGFDNNDEICQHSKTLAKKKTVALKNQEFLYEILRESFRILGRNGISEEKKLAERFMVICYIRIPEFRELFLNTITKSTDPPIEEWRGTSFQLDDDKITESNGTYSTPQENYFEHYFHWDKNFYEFIKHEPEYSQNMKRLKTIIRNESWKERISNRRGAFFGFIIELVEFAKSILVKISPENWKDFPGYAKILRALLCELKIRQVKQYPSSIKEVCTALLINENLLNILITIVFTKTNLHNNFDVVKVLIICNNLFISIKNQNKKIPSSFSYVFFFNCLKKVIENHYSYSVAEALCVIYDNFDLFPTQIQLQICVYLLGNVFYKLFLNWSHNVRNIFYHILIVKIIKLIHESTIEEEKNEHIKNYLKIISERLNQLFIVLENTQIIQNKQKSNKLKQELHQIMKNKLRQNKKLKNVTSSNKYPLKLDQLTINMIPLTETKSEEPLKYKNITIMESLAERYEECYGFEKLFKLIQERTDVNSSSDQSKDMVIRRKMRPERGESLFENQNSHILEGHEFNINDSLNSMEEVEFPTLLQEQLAYIQYGLSEFKQLCEESIKNCLQMDSVRISVALDKSEIKPESYRDVDEW